jgi:MFS family permease
MSISSIATRLQRPLIRIAVALKESVICFALGLRDSLHPRLLGFSLGIWILAFSTWLTVFIVWWQQIKALCIFLTGIFAAGIFFLMPMLSAGAASSATTAMGTIGGAANIGFLVGGILALFILPYVFVVLLFAVAMSLTIRVLLEIFVMGRIRQRALKTYPEIRTGLKSSLYNSIRDFINIAFTFLIVGTIFLMIPVVNGVFLFALLCYLNVRGLVNDALEGIATDIELRAVIKAERLTMTVLGMGLVAVVLVPFAGLISPTLTGSSVCHLCMRRLSKLRNSQDSSAVIAGSTRPLQAQ